MSKNARAGENDEFGKILPRAQMRRMFVSFAKLMQMSETQVSLPC